MNIVVRSDGAEYEVHVDVGAGHDTVADLAEALTGQAHPRVAIDGAPVPPTTPLLETTIGDGAVVELGAATDPRRRGRVVAESGIGFPLTAGSVTIGAAPADIPVSGCQGRIRLHTDDVGRLSIRNPEGVPVIVNGAVPTAAQEIPSGACIELAGHRLQVETNPPRTAGQRGILNRPPRPVVAHEELLITPPRVPDEPAGTMRFGWGALVVPLALGLAMAVLVHPRMAMFAIFSPAMLLANWFEDRHRVRREKEESCLAFREALAGFAADVGRAHRGAVADLHRDAIAPPELVGRAVQVDSRLWERRPEHGDFMELPIGTGCVQWRPELRGEVPPEAAAVLDEYGELHDVPVTIRFGPGDVTGLAGQRPTVLALARQLLLQAAVNHGPADLACTVFTERPSDWDWAKWLPHVSIDSAERRRLAATESEIESLVALLPEGDGAPSVHHLLIVDLLDLVGGARNKVRQALRAGKERGIAGLTLAARPLDLPAVATTIVAVEGDRARIRFTDGRSTTVTPWRMGAAIARKTARALVRVEDPEARCTGAGLPTVVHLGRILGLGDDLESSVAANWAAAPTRFAAPVGVSHGGVLSLDLVADGPHALLAGTTGAGKSELLRTLAASLAASTSPEALNFVLVDYKGGSAFDACAGLPHTVGVVTDLDDHLARRALQCLEAELRYREQRLREAGSTDIASYSARAAQPLPRLLVIVDEFAALAKELPDFISALVDVAQRGRSLGVHLLLATQRPGGVINDSIKANTNLRIALRVQDSAESVDVIGSGTAAALGRSQPGRGFARFGPSDTVPFQTALVTGRSISGEAGTVTVRPFVFAHEQPCVRITGSPDDDALSDLERIVAACRAVATTRRLPPPRLPWPEPLPAVIELAELPGAPSAGMTTAYALADEPRRQRQLAVSWSPAVGNLLLCGLPGSGTTTALGTIAVGLARDTSPESLHLYVLDFDDQLLAPLRRLPHVGAVVGAGDAERQLRLLRRLGAELEQRRQCAAADPETLSGSPVIVTMLDNYGGFADVFDESADMAVRNLFIRIVADGPGVGMFTIATAKHPGDVPTRLAALVGSKLAFKLADRYDYSALGLAPIEPPEAPGRAFESTSGREVQIALADRNGLAAAVDGIRWEAPRLAPWAIEVLPQNVSLSSVISAGKVAADEWFLPLGIGDTALAPAGLRLREGEHALITGPARAGKSTALATVAAVARAAHPGIRISALLPRRSPVAECADVDSVIRTDDAFADLGGTHLLLVDDAELVGDGPHMTELLAACHPHLHVVAAGSADAIRILYGHWTQGIRRSRIGCALRPNLAADGDLWQTPLPRRGPDQFPVGRGYLLNDGSAELVQLGRG